MTQPKTAQKSTPAKTAPKTAFDPSKLTAVAAAVPTRATGPSVPENFLNELRTSWQNRTGIAGSKGRERGTGRAFTVPKEHAETVIKLIRKAGEALGYGTSVGEPEDAGSGNVKIPFCATTRTVRPNRKKKGEGDAPASQGASQGV